MNKDVYIICVFLAPPATVFLPRPLTTDTSAKAAASNLSFLSSSTSVVGQRHFILFSLRYFQISLLLIIFNLLTNVLISTLEIVDI